MILWHVGGSLFLFRWIFRDPAVDVRYLVVGALLPDLIDKPLGTWLFADSFSSGRIYGHTLLFATVLMTAALFATRRGPTRRRWMALAIGCFTHLLLDGMWTSNEVFLWPAFGWDFPVGPIEFWGGLLDRFLSDPWMITQELLGAVYLVALWRNTGLGEKESRTRLIRTGQLFG